MAHTTDVLEGLQNAIAQVIDLHAPTQEIAVSELPGYVMKSLSTIVSDTDPGRIRQRLQTLKAIIEDAGTAIEKGGADTTIEVTDFAESSDLPAQGQAPTQSIHKLQKEIAELKALVLAQNQVSASLNGANESPSPTAKEKADKPQEAKPSNRKDNKVKDETTTETTKDETDDEENEDTNQDEEDDSKKSKSENKQPTKKNEAGAATSESDDPWPLDLNMNGSENTWSPQAADAT